MRFSLVHKLASYLMAVAAFCATALSGELHPLLVWGVAILIPLSWSWEPPRVRIERYELWWNLGTAACFLYVVFDFLRPEGSLLSSGVDLLAFLLTNKLFNRRTSKDYLQLYVISFLLLVAGTTLNTELSYAICFFSYVIFATWALTLFHLRREMEENYLLKHSGDEQSEKVEVERILNSRRIVGGPFLAGTSAVSMVVFLGALGIFFLFPRVGMGFFFARQRHGQTLAGFSERVDLGMHGAIKTNPQVVMRIEFPPSETPERLTQLHMRGVAFDAYAATGQWLHTRAERIMPLPTIDGVARAPGALPSDRADLRAEIYLDPLNSRVLFGPARPVRFELPPPIVPGQGRVPLLTTAEDEVYTAVERPAGFRYAVESAVKLPPPSVLASLPEQPPPPALARYLALPEGLSPSIAELARTITREAKGPYAKAIVVRSYLQRYRYTTDLRRMAGGDPLADFLFRARAGHCEYFATAMAVLLRAVGVPTREVNGFYGGEWNDWGKYLAVRQMDAHAWVEVWFPHYGWVMFDPTPPGAARAAAPTGLWSKLRQIEDSVELAWYKHMVEYNLDQQVELARTVRKLGARLQIRLPKLARRPATGLLVLVACVLSIVLARRALRRRGREGPAVRAAVRRIQQPMLSLYQTVLRRCARAGAVRGAAQTPLEFARGLAARSFPGADVVGEATELYYRTRFGGRVPGPAELGALEQKLDRIGVTP